jgi:hypothetical protein
MLMTADGWTKQHKTNQLKANQNNTKQINLKQTKTTNQIPSLHCFTPIVGLSVRLVGSSLAKIKQLRYRYMQRGVLT